MDDFKCAFAEISIEVGFQSTNITGTEGDCVSICLIIKKDVEVGLMSDIKLRITDITTSMLTSGVSQSALIFCLSTFQYFSFTILLRPPH